MFRLLRNSIGFLILLFFIYCASTNNYNTNFDEVFNTYSIDQEFNMKTIVKIDGINAQEEIHLKYTILTDSCSSEFRKKIRSEVDGDLEYDDLLRLNFYDEYDYENDNDDEEEAKRKEFYRNVENKIAKYLQRISMNTFLEYYLKSGNIESIFEIIDEDSMHNAKINIEFEKEERKIDEDKDDDQNRYNSEDSTSNNFLVFKPELFIKK